MASESCVGRGLVSFAIPIVTPPTPATLPASSVVPRSCICRPQCRKRSHTKCRVGSDLDHLCNSEPDEFLNSHSTTGKPLARPRRYSLAKPSPRHNRLTVDELFHRERNALPAIFDDVSAGVNVMDLTNRPASEPNPTNRIPDLGLPDVGHLDASAIAFRIGYTCWGTTALPSAFNRATLSEIPSSPARSTGSIPH